jgi:GNAT superfamily N-acetyltransferase
MNGLTGYVERRITVRGAVSTDSEVWLALVDALADYEKLDRPTPEARERLVRDAFGAAPRIDVWMVEADGEAIGYATTLETYSSFLALPTLYLEDLFVVPEARGGGAGQAVFGHLAAEALRRGCGRMEWVVLAWNELAIGFYERLGATRMDGWHTYRLTADDLRQIAPAANRG